jgi:antitoxin (DNA-binding transcriptional repressor) of toxin-antitoxin stability system
MLHKSMVRMSVREIRLKWPQAERLLAVAEEIVVTRDSKPVARIVPYGETARTRRGRFDPDEHVRWLRRFWKGKPRQPSTDQLLANDRNE